MTPLRQRMLEELCRHNYAPRTRQTYVAQIAKLAKHFGVSPDHLTREQVQEYRDLLASQGVSWLPQAVAAMQFFYVEEEGRIIGDIAWEFKDFTSVAATPCNDNYLVIEGGGFYFSGDTPDGSSGYHQHGISVQRSRAIIRGRKTIAASRPSASSP